LIFLNYLYHVFSFLGKIDNFELLYKLFKYMYLKWGENCNLRVKSLAWPNGPHHNGPTQLYTLNNSNHQTVVVKKKAGDPNLAT
jgi:hypothetical protein